MITIPDNEARVLALDARHLIYEQDGNHTAVESYLRRIIDALPDPGTPTFLDEAQRVIRLAPTFPDARAAEFANALVEIAKRADAAVAEAARAINALNADVANQRDQLTQAGKNNTRRIAQLSGYRSLIDTDDLPDEPADANPEHLFIGRVDGQITTVQRFINDPANGYPWRDINNDWHRDDEVELLALIATDNDAFDYYEED